LTEAVLILLIVLIVTNLGTVGVLAWFVLRPVEHPRPDAAVARRLDNRRPATSTSSVRRVITIEILNPIELAGSRGWWAGVAGSLAPGLTNRVVYDQAMRLVRTQLADHNVVADVRLHVVDPSAIDDGPTTLAQ
jgi:hypothetical protein